MVLTRIKQRKHFVRAATEGKKAIAKGLILQVVSTPSDIPALQENDTPLKRVGFTVTKKTGSAVIRNKIKRRLRVLAEELLSHYAKAGFDYVIIGRKAALSRDFEALRRDVRYCLHNTGAFSKSKDIVG